MVKNSQIERQILQARNCLELPGTSGTRYEGNRPRDLFKLCVSTCNEGPTEPHVNTNSTNASLTFSPAATPKQASITNLPVAPALPPASGFIDTLQVLALRSGARISTASNPLEVRKDGGQGAWKPPPGQRLSYQVNSFTQATGHRAVIGSLEIEAMLRGKAGTQVRTDEAATL